MSEAFYLGFILSGTLLLSSFGLFWWVLQIIANWRIFTKAGEAGWKSIIPIYSGHIAYKIAWKPIYYWLSLVLSFASEYLADTIKTLGSQGISLSFLSLVLAVLSFILYVKYCSKLSKAFGKGLGTTFGLIFLHPFFVLYLGFGNARYIGADL